MDQFDFQIMEHIATLNSRPGRSLELNMVSFNGRPAMLDVRTWAEGGDGSKQPLKGVRLTDAEARALRDALAAYLGDK